MKFKSIIIIAFLSILSISCKKNFLDKTPDEDLLLEDVFANRQYTEAFLTSVYSKIPEEMNYTAADGAGQNPFVGASDEMELPYNNAFSRFMNNGSWAPDNTMDQIYVSSFQSIRKANIFLENIGKVPIDEETRKQWIGEATFLRAFYNFMLFRVYGPIPIIEQAAGASDDFSTIRRATLKESANSIIADCDRAASLLKPTLNNRDIGRATSIAALALKSRLLLYMASPLYNGNPDYANFKNAEGVNFFPAFDATAWSTASNAAKAAIDAAEAVGHKLYRAPNNDPMKNYSDLFLVMNNSEVLFARNMGPFRQFEMTATPNKMGGWSGLAPTQEMVDSYQMANGMTPITGYNPDGTPIIDAASGYVETGYSITPGPNNYYLDNIRNMYVGREPRFYASINFTEAFWRGRRISFMIAGLDGKGGGPDFTPTGYLMKKYSDPTLDVKIGPFPLKSWIFFRLGELYLNYAEALNEASSTPPTDVYKYVNFIRNRVGLPDLAAGLNKNDMRLRIRHERRIELAFETHRYFDTHRWKLSEVIDNRNITGMDVNTGTSGHDDRYFKRTVIEKRVFLKKHYLWPYPQAEINKVPGLIQNPGW